jgi:hypothetical protein
MDPSENYPKKFEDLKLTNTVNNLKTFVVVNSLKTILNVFAVNEIISLHLPPQTNESLRILLKTSVLGWGDFAVE